MPIFTERILLPILAAAIVVLAITNPLNFGLAPRILYPTALLLVGLTLAMNLHRHNERVKQQPTSTALAPMLTSAHVPSASVVVTPPEVETDQAYFREIFRNHTEIQAEKLVHSYIGQWTAVRGTVRDVNVSMQNQVRVAIDREDDKGAGVFAYFPRSATYAELLRRGQSVRVRGKIAGVHESHIRLEDCELIA